MDWERIQEILQDIMSRPVGEGERIESLAGRVLPRKRSEAADSLWAWLAPQWGPSREVLHELRMKGDTIDRHSVFTDNMLNSTRLRNYGQDSTIYAHSHPAGYALSRTDKRVGRMLLDDGDAIASFTPYGIDVQHRDVGGSIMRGVGTTVPRGGRNSPLPRWGLPPDSVGHRRMLGMFQRNPVGHLETLAALLRDPSLITDRRAAR